MVAPNCSANKIKVDFSKNRYYSKGNFIIENNRKSGKKTKVASFVRDPNLLYFVKGNGVVGTAPRKNASKSKRSSSHKKK